MDLRRNTLLWGWVWTLTSRGIYKTRGMSFEVPLKDFPMRARPFFWRDTYEKEERAMVAEYLRRGDHVLEIGGGLGVVACDIDRVIGTGGRHVLVEANPALISLIARNRKTNGAHFTLMHAALADTRSVNFGGGENFLEGNIHGGAEPVVGYTLKELFSYLGNFNVLVIDIEGAETILLAQLAEVSEMVRTIVIELHPLILGPERILQLRREFERLDFVTRREDGDVVVYEKA
jgi:FkbM family methyltransferase